MDAGTNRHGPTTGQIKRMLFDTKRRRRWFINARILAGRRSTDPLESAEQWSNLGPVIVFASPPYAGALRQEWWIGSEVLLLDAAEIDAKRELAYEWIRSVSARDIAAHLIVYTLTPDKHDFATMEIVLPPWIPTVIEPGARIRYTGIARPQPGARGISLDVNGIFEITDHVLGLDFSGEPWWEMRDLEVGDTLYLSQALLTTATFLKTGALPAASGAS